MRTDSKLMFFLEQTAAHLQRMRYRKRLSYEFSHSWGDLDGEPDLDRPAYVLFFYYGDDLFLTVAYEIDARFKDELDPREVSRIEGLLADRAMGVIGVNGITTLLRSKSKTGDIPFSYILETEDKKFLSLN